MIVKDTPPCFLQIGGYRCRTWFRGQPLVYLCMDPRHKSADCPDRENAENVNSRVILPVNAPLWKNAIDVTALITQLVNVQMLGVAVGLQRSLLPLRRKKILLLPLIFSLPPLLLFLRRPLFQTGSEEPALTEDLPTDDSDSESETFVDVPESKEIGCDFAILVARTAEFGKKPDSSPVIIQASMDCLPPEDSVNDASTPALSAVEEDQSSVISNDSSDVFTMDDLCRATCAALCL